MRRPTHALRRYIVAASAVAFLATAAACTTAEGKPAAAGTSPGAAATSSDGTTAALKYAACMRVNGVQVEDPKPGEGPRIPEGVPQSSVDKAQEVCGKSPSGAAQSSKVGELKRDAEYEALQLKADNCMRKAGYVRPDTGADSKEMHLTPELTAAREACKAEVTAVDNKLKELVQQGGAQ
ncbi:hypothetical protein AB0D66_30815 [Streptomyces sp. NPDC048270]|uniref:hypothetical protein n=1 Tax=Streptomyces sp. NPDC048270 TaxID=3154615 RepID=UPI0033EC9A05